jgi:hypothetical protein
MFLKILLLILIPIIIADIVHLRYHIQNRHTLWAFIDVVFICYWLWLLYNVAFVW